MRKILFVFTAGLAIWSCSTVKDTSGPSAGLEQNNQDSTIYEVVIIDNQFDQWYLMNFTPVEDRSDEYYRSKNIMAVANWNGFYNSGKYKRFVDCYIDYWPTIDYGIEVNRRLFWYFKYIEETSGIRLVY
jgi:hypothetical protein